MKIELFGFAPALVATFPIGSYGLSRGVCLQVDIGLQKEGHGRAR